MKYTSLESRISKVEKRFTLVDQKDKEQDQWLAQNSNRITALEEKIDGIFENC